MGPALLVLLTFAAPPVSDDQNETAGQAERTEISRLLGGWELVGIEQGGERENTTEDDGVCYLEFAATTLRYLELGKRSGSDVLANYKLHADRNPPVIEIEGEGISWKAIYQLDGDTLSVALVESTQRLPRHLRTKPGDDQEVRFYKRRPKAVVPTNEKDDKVSGLTKSERAYLDGVWQVIATVVKGEPRDIHKNDFNTALSVNFYFIRRLFLESERALRPR